MATSLARLSSRRLQLARSSSATINRGFVTALPVSDGNGFASSRWTANNEHSKPALPHYALSDPLSSPIRSFSTASDEKAASVDETNIPEETIPPPPPSDKDLHKESLQFQAETKQLLDIVTHSLYTDKEVFLRELVSNASDALEKLRHLQVANIDGKEIVGSDIPLEIRIETDELNQTLTITDTGIGLTRDDMITNLGTIAKSGSKAFMNELQNAASSDAQLDPAKGIIGKFGVGFYSAFMVGDKVDVRSRYVQQHIEIS